MHDRYMAFGFIEIKRCKRCLCVCKCCTFIFIMVWHFLNAQSWRWSIVYVNEISKINQFVRWKSKSDFVCKKILIFVERTVTTSKVKVFHEKDTDVISFAVNACIWYRSRAVCDAANNNRCIYFIKFQICIHWNVFMCIHEAEHDHELTRILREWIILKGISWTCFENNLTFTIGSN